MPKIETTHYEYVCDICGTDDEYKSMYQIHNKFICSDCIDKIIDDNTDEVENV